MLNLEEYCSLKVNELIAESGLRLEANSHKTDVLVKAAPIYLKKGKINKKVKNIVTDKRFIRLYQTKVRDLQRMLNDNSVPAPKQGKAKMAAICYEKGLDSFNFRGSSDESGSSDEYLNCYINGTEITSGYVFKIENKLYCGNQEMYMEITNDILMQLFKYLVESRNL